MQIHTLHLHLTALVMLLAAPKTLSAQDPHPNKGSAFVRLPAAREILLALPRANTTTLEHEREKVRIACERNNHAPAQTRFYPMIGKARLTGAEFKCTVTSNRGTEKVVLSRWRLVQGN